MLVLEGLVGLHQFSSVQSCPTLCNPMDCSSNAEEAEVEWFYEDLQDLLELIPKKDVLFIIGDLNAKLES